MSRSWRLLSVMLLLSAALTPGTVAALEPQLKASHLSVTSEASGNDSSVLFIENVGQFAEGARFQVWGGDRTIWLAEDGIWITVLEAPHPHPLSAVGERGEDPRSLLDRTAEESEPRRGVNLKLSFSGGNPHPRLEPFNRLETHVSYFIGNEPAQWHPDVPVWGGLRYVDLYPGIDLELVGERGRMVQRLVARPGADLSAMRLRVDGADGLALDGDRLRITTALGEYVLPLLQVSSAAAPDARRPTLEGKQVALPFAEGSSGPSLGAAISLTSDLLYATFLGGSGEDVYGIAVDGGGNAYVTGSTDSPDLPTTSGAFETSYNGGDHDAFVAKLNPFGSALVYATFLGGSYDDEALSIAVDGGCNAYVTGWTSSSDFPTMPGAFDTRYNGDEDAFVARLNPAGSALVYATFLGGSDYDDGWGIAVDGGGNAYVTGYTYSSDFSTTPGAFDTSFSGNRDAFVAKLSPSGSALVYATFLGSGTDFARGIAVDGGGNAYVTGETQSSDFTTPGAFDTSYNGNGDAFVAKLSPSGSALVYATFLGGTHNDFALSIAVDGGGNAYVTGDTHSSDFPTTPGAVDRTLGGDHDAFVAKLNPFGSALVYATFLGGSYYDTGWGIAVDGGGNAYVTGETQSSDFPTTPGAFDTSYNGAWDDAFVAKLNPSGSALVYATFLGGSTHWDYGSGIAVDGGGNAYVTGHAGSSDFPTTPGAFDTSPGGFKAFVAKLAMGKPPTIYGRVTEASSGAAIGVRASAGLSVSGVPGVTISAGSGGSTTTDEFGFYSLTPIYGPGIYTLTPSKEGYTFSAVNQRVELLTDVTAQDFTALVCYAVPAPFLELPFQYPPGQFALFAQGNTCQYGAGRVNSWFDHHYPTYCKLPNEGSLKCDPPKPPKDLTRWDGRVFNFPASKPTKGRSWYDGHNGIDFAYVGWPSPVLAAADGVVMDDLNKKCTDQCKYGSCHDCGIYGNYVVLRHNRGVGQVYYTRYGHLSTVDVTNGQVVTKGSKLGDAGSTGNSDAVHLHFGVYRDNDGKGVWNGESIDKPVDPFGWDPARALVCMADPWATYADGAISHPLWLHAVSTVEPVSCLQACYLKDTVGTVGVDIAAGTFGGQVTLDLSTGPVAEPSAQLRTAGRSFLLTVLEWLSGVGCSGSASVQQVSDGFSLLQPVTLTVTYTQGSLVHLDPSQLTLQHWNEEEQLWYPLRTTVDLVNGAATAQSWELGEFNLQAPLLCPADSLEPDDSVYDAGVILPNGQAVSRLFDIAEDEDWFRAEMEPGWKYIVETKNLSAGVDTVIEVFDSDGLTLLASDDNGGDGAASRLEWRAPLTGTYFIRASQASGSSYGCSAAYELYVTPTSPPLRIYLPVVLRNPEVAGSASGTYVGFFAPGMHRVVP